MKYACDGCFHGRFDRQEDIAQRHPRAAQLSTKRTMPSTNLKWLRKYAAASAAVADTVVTAASAAGDSPRTSFRLLNTPLPTNSSSWSSPYRSALAPVMIDHPMNISGSAERHMHR
eukprot:CAMPEP_0181184642 /NCGR_PEP_ID=MMETSP1096-20121128/9077_1 /TAXON_ID=156174 ORGANISM="Chrysochromulina ericina, Strain CCMP281" /NCGR_SAMPLE_ID=MMETSP1096 /ASSEMBLY_ACC=CAM_ASM_000453 /LENGTH=115 /DNA_ID=CAMNT_0023273421 /DNA_START=369 /DNA_END=716 /DNA_ORIENTATION=-